MNYLLYRGNPVYFCLPRFYALFRCVFESLCTAQPHTTTGVGRRLNSWVSELLWICLPYSPFGSCRVSELCGAYKAPRLWCSCSSSIADMGGGQMEPLYILKNLDIAVMSSERCLQFAEICIHADLIILDPWKAMGFCSLSFFFFFKLLHIKAAIPRMQWLWICREWHICQRGKYKEKSSLLKGKLVSMENMHPAKCLEQSDCSKYLTLCFSQR